jgi:hypothetical protein
LSFVSIPPLPPNRASETPNRPLYGWPFAIAAALVVTALVTAAYQDNPFVLRPINDPAGESFLRVLAIAVIRDVARFPLVQFRLVASRPDTWAPIAAISLTFAATWILGRRRRTPISILSIENALGIGSSAALVWWILRGGEFDWTQHDWPKEWAYFSGWRDALQAGQLPWLMRSGFQGTDQFLANPETLLGPQTVLLLWLPVPAFVVLNTVAYAVAGLLGIAMLAREHKLDSMSTFALMLLFVANGQVAGHLTVGHVQWAAYFLLPFLFLFLAREAAGAGPSDANAAFLGLTFGGMLVTGGWHVFVWSLLFAGIFTLVNRRWRFGMALAMFTVGISAFRVIPGLMVFGGGNNQFVGGFANVFAFNGALIGTSPAALNDLSWWEYDTFIGWMGFVAVAVGCTSTRVRSGAVHALWLPSLALIVLSMGSYYGSTLFHLPPFNSERVVSRLAVVGVLGLLLIGLKQISAWRADPPSAAREITFAAAALLLTAQLMIRAEAIRPEAAIVRWPSGGDGFKPLSPDNAYVVAVATGVMISALAAAYAARLLMQRSRFTRALAD